VLKSIFHLLSRFAIVDKAKFDLVAVLKGKRTKLPNELSRIYVFRSEIETCHCHNETISLEL
jgi:hypothetical protein